MWAILSGSVENLLAYEAVIPDINYQKNHVQELYLLGDLVGPTKECERLIKRVELPRIGELKPMISKGWWEEQCLILHGLGPTGDTPELIAQYGGNTVKRLWDSISPATVQWLRSLYFGFFELDCLLTHG
jgi:hypothetical protein